jgi:hypothetical protein
MIRLPRLSNIEEAEVREKEKKNEEHQMSEKSMLLSQPLEFYTSVGSDRFGPTRSNGEA